MHASVAGAPCVQHFNSACTTEYRHDQRCLGRINRSGSCFIASTMPTQESHCRAKTMSCANRSVLRGRSRMQSRYSGGFGLNTRDRLPGLRAAGSLGAQRSVWFVCFSVHPNSSPHSSRASNNNLNYSVTHVFCHHNHCNGFDSISHFLASRKRPTMNPVGSGRSYT